MGKSKKASAQSSSSNGGEGNGSTSQDNFQRAERGKIVVSLQPHNLENNRATINFAQDEFYNVFQYPPSALPMHLSRLFGDATDRRDIRSIETAIITKKSHVGYVVLYRSDGYGLPCHVSVVSIDGGNGRSGGVSETKQTFLQASRDSQRWSVLTIRNANAVGNSRYCGIGLLGLDRVLPEKYEELGVATGKEPNSKKAKELAKQSNGEGSGKETVENSREGMGKPSSSSSSSSSTPATTELAIQESKV